MLNRKGFAFSCHSSLVTALDDPDFLQRFQNEAASTGRIHHPNVVTIYESGQADDGTPYIAMEFLEGESLRQALSRRGQLPVPEVAEILQQAARGLNAAHKLGIIHRDLKPDNIFLTYPDDVGATLVVAPGRAQGPPLQPVVGKLVDFGIAKLRESASHTQTGMVLGTPAYMSFEQASGMRSDELDARSDTYSLGVVVYEMLTGRTPFWFGSAELFFNHAACILRDRRGAAEFEKTTLHCNTVNEYHFLRAGSRQRSARLNGGQWTRLKS